MYNLERYLVLYKCLIMLKKCMNCNKYSICFFDFKCISKYKYNYSHEKQAIEKAIQILDSEESNIIDFVGGT